MADLAPSKAALLTASALPVAAPYNMAATENNTQTTAIAMLPPPHVVLIKFYGVSDASMSAKYRFWVLQKMQRNRIQIKICQIN
jgi:hypothetical protein